jgi:GNAT superfamily N-acetyltransferase
VSDVTIRHLRSEEIYRVGEVDRSEHVALGYVFRRGVLESQQVDWQVPRWSDDASVGFSVQRHIAQWKPILDEGGILLGALDGESLVGFAILRPELSEGTAQLAGLYVDRAYRRLGVATSLVAEAERLAREAGAVNLYVSAIPSGSAVGFYLERGFSPTEEPNEELYALEPDDSHMIKRL